MILVRYTTAREEFGECEGPRPVVYKILRQPMTDPVFQSICANTATLALFAHIRAASGETAISIFNNHPFHFGRWSFMHNGVVTHFQRIKREIIKEISDEALELVKGTTDSEHLAALFFTYLEETKGSKAWEYSHPLQDVKAALEKAITTILGIQKRVLEPSQPEASSLNIAITDGQQLLTMRFRNHATEHPPSLYFSTTAGVSLNRKFPGHPDKEGDNGAQNVKDVESHGAHVIVASEPSTFRGKDWELINKNECIMVGTDMEMRREKIQVQF